MSKVNTSGTETSMLNEDLTSEILPDLNDMLSNMTIDNRSNNSPTRKHWKKGDKIYTKVVNRPQIKEDWHKPDARDKEKFISYVARKKTNKHKRKRAIARARGNIKPEGLFELISRAQNNASDFLCVDACDAGSTERQRWVDEVKSLTQRWKKDSTDIDVANVIIRMGGFIWALSQTKTQSDVVTLSIGVLTQYFDFSYVEQLYEWCNDGIQPQGDSVASAFANVRVISSTIAEAPCGRFLFNIFSLSVLSGLKAHEMVPIKEAKMFLKKIELDIFRTATMKTYFDCILDISEYVAMAFDSFKKGIPLIQYLFPNSLQQEIVDAQISAERINSGDFDETDPNCLEKAVCKLSDLELKLKNALNRNGDVKTNLWIQAGYRTVKNSRLLVEGVQAKAQFRRKPFCIGLHGSSQIGKTNLMGLLRNIYGAVNGKQYLPHEIATISDAEKYDDAIRNNTKVLQIDDVNSVKVAPGQANESTIGKVVKIVNNVSQPTNQSDVSRKDKIYHQEELVILTSNDASFGIISAFNTPIAAANRIMMVEVFLLPEYAKDGKLNTELLTKISEAGLPCPPLHEFVVYEYRPAKVGNGIERHDVTEKLNTKDFLEYFANRAKRHVIEQNSLYKGTSMLKEASMCAECCLPKQTYCTCGGKVFVPDPTLIRIKPESLVSSYAFSMMEDMAMNMMYNAAHYFGRAVTHQTSRFVQRNAFRIVISAAYVAVSAFRYLKYWEMRLCALICGLYVCYLQTFVWETGTLFNVYLGFLGLVILAFMGYGNALMDSFAYEATRSFLNKQTRSILCGSLALCTFIGVVRKLYALNKYNDESILFTTDGFVQQPPSRVSSITETQASPPRVLTKPEGNILPRVYEDIAARHAEPCPWSKERIRPVTFEHKLKTMTLDHVVDKLRKSMYKITMMDELARRSCFTTCLCDTVWVVSKHVWKMMSNPNCQVTLFRDKGVVAYSNISAYYVPEGDHDVVLVQLLGVGDFSDVTHFLSDEEVTNQACKFVSRDAQMEIVTDDVYVRRDSIFSSSGVLPEKGLLYTKMVPTKDGDCGSVLITISKPHRIVGFHCGGDSTGNCAATLFKKSWVEEFQKRAINFSPEGGDPFPFGLGDNVDLDPYGLGAPNVSEFDERHCVVQRNSEEGGVFPVEYLPNTRITPHTEIKYNLLKPHLEEAGMPIMYGPPQFHSNRDHDAVLEEKTTHMTLIENSLMRRAIDDYFRPIVEYMRKIKYPKAQPLELEEVFNGREGDRFLGPMKTDTSAGFGGKGPKDRDLLEVVYLPDGRKHVSATPLLENRFNKCMEQLKQGQRLNPIFRTSLKDEPVKYENGEPKKANRVFYAGQTDSLCCTKSLFGPVASVLMSLPTITECAGGINSFGNEWTQLFEHVTKYGKDRILAGDYKAWDQNVSSQLIRACGTVCLHIAKELGYTKEQLLCMNGLISDIAVSYVSFNGALCLFDGLMPSGDFCTLIFNSIGNALLHRCAFFAPGLDGTMALRPGTQFRDHVSMIFMGDDSIGSSKGHFSMRDMQAFCRSIGLTYTDDKKSVENIPSYVNIFDVDFCKRRFRYEPFLDEYVAPLDLKSIDKAIYVYRESELDEVTYIVQNIEAQMREYARHEDAVFEERRSMVLKACLSANIYHHVASVFDKTRYDWLADFRVRYYTFDDIGSDLSDSRSI